MSRELGAWSMEWEPGRGKMGAGRSGLEAVNWIFVK